MRFCIFFCLLPMLVGAQTGVLNGNIRDKSGAAMPEVLVYWSQHKDIVATTDEAGFFALPFYEADTLFTRFVGVAPVALYISKPQSDLVIEVNNNETLQTFEVTAKAADFSISTLTTLNIESIGEGELKKAPCCNLSEAFETNAAVDVSYADAVTGAREVQLLGMRGIYTLLQIEGRPAFYGLGAPFALEYIPGTWLRGIQISKGTGSALSGYQTIAGQININLQRPDLDDPLMVNVYAEQTGRYEANVHLNKIINKKLSHGLLLHGSSQQRFLDHNHDGFADMPVKQQLNGMYRVRLDLPGWCIEGNVHALTEDRKNGQLQAASNTDAFKVASATQRMEVFGKVGYTGFVEPYRSMGLQWSALYHNMDGQFGARAYAGTQRSAYLNYMYATIIGTSDHKITMGSTLQIDDFREQLMQTNLNRTEWVPGVVAEYTYDHLSAKGTNNFSIVGGMRLDHNSRLGLLFSPRMHMRYNPTEKTAIRFNIGQGFRSPNLVADNIAMLATNRTIVFPDAPLKAEQAWNTGVNITHQFEVMGRPASINSDLYHTRFVQQVVADYDSDPLRTFIYQLDGPSYTTAWLSTFQFFVIEDLSVRLSYKYTDPRMTLRNEGLQPVILQVRQRALATVTWKSENEHWMLNGSAQFTGSQRLPDHSNLPIQYRNYLPQNSPNYTLFNAQASYLTKRFDIYLGCENIAGLTQHNAIIAWDQPDSPWFDATQLYAPMMGRRIYTGIRFRVGKK